MTATGRTGLNVTDSMAMAPRCDATCQVRKGKCDGQRLCAWYRDQEKPCEYEVLAGETRMRANKRKHEDIEQEHQQLLELVDIAALRSDAGDILSI